MATIAEKTEKGQINASTPVLSRSPLTRKIILYVFGCFPIEWIDRIGDYIRVARLRKRLASCGDRTAIYKGFFVERPELAHIGEDVSIGPDISIIGAGGVIIRDGAMLATRITILTTQHDPVMECMRQTAIHSKVDIGEFTWVGAGATLLPGVSIGRHAIVGAGALVTRDVPSYALAVGVPARVIREDRRQQAGRKAVEAECHE